MQKGKTEKGVQEMTGNIASFYLFIRNHYSTGTQGEYSYEDFKAEVDTNGNGTIQFNELDSFFKRTSAFQNMNTTDTLDIWNQIDRNRNGMVGGVSNNGALDAVEETRINNQVVVYGQIYEKVKEVLPSRALQSITSATKFDAETVYSEIVTAYIQQYGTNVPNDPDDFTNKVKEACVKGTCTLVTKSVANDDDIQSELRNKVPNDYKLTGDLNLLSLINKATLTFDMLSSINNSDGYYKLVKHIVGRYMREAGIGNSGWDDYHNDVIDTNMSWKKTNPNQLSELQKNVLLHCFETTISINALKASTGKDLSGFSSEFNAVYKEYKDAKFALNQAGYATYITTALNSSSLRADFANHTTVGGLLIVADTYNQAKATCTSVNNYNSWYDICKNLHSVGGMSEADVVRLVNSDAFKTVLIEAAAELQRAGYKWGVPGADVQNVTLTMGYGTNNEGCIVNWGGSYVQHYIKQHMDEILNKIGETDKVECEETLFWNARNSAYCNSKDNTNNPKPYYSINTEVNTQARMYIDYVCTLGSGAVNAAIDALKTTCSGANTSSVSNANDLKSWFSEHIKSWTDDGNGGVGYTMAAKILKAVHEAVQAVIKPTSGNNPTGGDASINVSNALTYIKNTPISVSGFYHCRYGTADRWFDMQNNTFTYPMNITDDEGYDIFGSTESERSSYGNYTRLYSSMERSGYQDGAMEWGKLKISVYHNFGVFAESLRLAAVNQKVSSSKAEQAKKYLIKYFEAAFDRLMLVKTSGGASVFDSSEDYDCDEDLSMNEYACGFKVKDDSGNEIYDETGGIVFSSGDQESNRNEISDFSSYLGKSGTGIYVGCDNTGNDNYFIFIDMEKMAEKFNTFLGLV